MIALGLLLEDFSMPKGCCCRNFRCPGGTSLRISSALPMLEEHQLH